MVIETTLNMHNNILERINFASKKVKKSRTYIIRLILGKMIEDNNKFKRLWSPVKYQKRDVYDNWHIFHLTLRQDEYAFSMDLRRIYRMSLSGIVAYAVDEYLDGVISMVTEDNNENITDNYLYKNYIIAYRLVDGVHSWRIYWGYTDRDLFNHQILLI